MLRMSGYFFDGSKSGGFCTQVSIRRPSKLVYQISSGSVRFSFEKRSSLMCVSCFGVAPGFSSQNKSPIRVGVEIRSTIFDPSSVAQKLCTAWLPVVRSVSFPLVASKAPRFALPSLPYKAMMVLPFADQTGGKPPPPRGDELSPNTPEPTSQSKSRVRLRGWAFSARSITQRSGCVYDRTGLEVDA